MDGLGSRAALSGAAYAGIFIFGIVMALLGAVLPLVGTQIGFNLAQAGGLFFAMNLAMLLVSLTVGPLIDHFGKKAPMLGGVALAGLALPLIAGAGAYSTLLVAVVILGAGGGALNAASNALIADLYADPREKNAKLNLLGVPFGFGALFLPFVIGSLLEAVGLKTILNATACLCGAIALLFAVLRFPVGKRASGRAFRSAAALLRNPLVLAFGFLLFFESGNEFTMGGYATSLLTRELGMTVSAASYLLAVYWAAIMVTRIGLSRALLLFRGEKVVGWSAVAAAAGIILLLSAPSPALAAIGLAITGAGFASIFPTTLGLAGAKFEGDAGTVFGILIAIALTGGMTLPWAVGQVAQAFGLRTGLVLSAWACMMILVLQVVITRFARSRRLPTGQQAG